MPGAEHEGPAVEESASGWGRVNRRTLIKGAAAAGVVAWAAPVIVESMASPAAAAVTCFNAREENISTTPDCAPGGVGGSACVSTTGTTADGSCSKIHFTHNGDGSWTVSVAAGCTLVQVGAFYGVTNCRCFCPDCGSFGCGACTTNGSCGTSVNIPATDGQHGLSHIDAVACCHS
jgi:hypothetical protein